MEQKERLKKNSQDNYFGLIVEESSLKLVKVKHGNKIASYSSLAIPEGIVANDRVKNQKKLAQLISKLKKEAKPNKEKSNFCVIGLPENQIFIQTIEVPEDLTDPEISKTVEHRSSELFPMPYEDIILDWQVIDRIEKKKKILIIAAPGKLIKSIIDSVRLAGVEPLAVEPKSFSVYRLLNFILKRQSLIIIDFESSSASLSIYQKGKIKFHTKISQPLTSEKIVGGISRTLHYYRDKYPNDKPISRVILSGDLAGKDYLNDIGKNFSRVQVEKITLPKLHYPKDFETKKTYYASAIALALGRINIFSKHQIINLLPTEIKNSHRVDLSHHYLGLITRLVSVVLVFLIGVLAIYNYKLSFDSFELAQAIKGKQNYKISSSLKDKEETIKIVNQKSSQLVQLYQSNRDVPSLTGEIVGMIPSGINLTNLNLTDDKVVISGIGSRQDILRFKDSLSNHDQVSNVSLPLSSLAKRNQADFQIMFSISFNK